VTDLQWHDPTGRIIGDNSDRYVHCWILKYSNPSVYELNSFLPYCSWGENS
jgi:hypothetical protein